MASTSNPSSPTSHRRRRSSHFDNRAASAASFHSRRSSQASVASHRRTASRASDTPLSPAIGVSQELGDSLADELANAWDEENDESFYEEPTEPEQPEAGTPHTPQPSSPVASRDQDTPGPTANGTTQSSPSKRNGTPKASASRHARNRSLYDGEGYPGIEEEYSTEATEFSRELEQTIRDVEKLASQNPSAGSKQDAGKPDAVTALLASLQNLGNQSSFETHATRLITAHTSLTTHLAFQTRAFQTVSFPLLSPLSAPPTPEALDELLPLLTSAISLIPHPSHTSLSSLSYLSSTSSDAIAALSTLSDSLHMCRQVESTAARRLKSAREGVAEMRREYEAADRAQRHVLAGRWDERLRERSAAAECRDIVSGFEQVCGQMREQLAASAAVAAG